MAAIRFLFSLVPACALALAAGSVGSAEIPQTCPAGYSYAGLWSETPSAGVAATIAAVEPAQVEAGHVAAWVTVGNAASWLQVGLNATPGSPQKLYYETVLPGSGATQYVELARDVPLGQPHRVALVEIPGRPAWWRVYVDGVEAAPDIAAPASHGRWRASVAAESWRPVAGPCNRYRYGFAAVQVQPRAGGRWEGAQALPRGVDPGYRLAPAPGAAPAFDAVSRTM